MHRALSRVSRGIIAYFVIGFALHLIWENAQSPLYDCFDPNDLWMCFRLCLRAAAGGDMVFMGVLYAALACVHRDWFWINQLDAYRHPATWILPPLIGVLLAVSMELWAVHVDHRWAYTASMPILPIVRVGLTPVLQMIAIPLLAPLIVFRLRTKSPSIA